LYSIGVALPHEEYGCSFPHSRIHFVPIGWAPAEGSRFNGQVPDPPGIFISYSSRDVHEAETLESFLRAAEFDVWRDKRNLETDWSGEIATALAERADAVCLVWSKNAAESQWVRNERLTARAIEKLTVPWVLAEAPPLPPPLVNLTPQSDPAGLCRMLNAAPPRYDYTIASPNVHVPFRPSPALVLRCLRSSV
jgi:hypothetical protein